MEHNKLQRIWTEICTAPSFLINLFQGMHRDCLLKIEAKTRIQRTPRIWSEWVKLRVCVKTDNNYVRWGIRLMQSCYIHSALQVLCNLVCFYQELWWQFFHLFCLPWSLVFLIQLLVRYSEASLTGAVPEK